MIIEDITYDNTLNQFILFIENKKYNVSYTFYEQFQLHQGMTLSAEVLEYITQESLKVIAMQDAINYLSYRQRTEKEVRDKLLKKYAPEIVMEIIDRFVTEGTLNDALFAKVFVGDKVRLTDWSRRKVEHELYLKGVSKDKYSIDELYPMQLEYEKAERIIEKKIDTWRRKYSDPYQLQSKISQFLYSKGYDYDIIQQLKDKY